MKKVTNYFSLIRIKHYIKNLLIFLPLIFSRNLFNKNYLLKSLLGFIVFSFVCSIVYIINDLKDIEKDKLHFKKKNRPLASGAVTKKEAYIIIFILAILAIIGSFILKLKPLYISLLLLYLIVNILYSFILKNIPILDVAILTFGFVLRVIWGGGILDIKISNWLILTIIAISFYLSLGKRRNEIANTKASNDTRPVLKYYNQDFLDKNMYMFLGMGVVFYSLWTIDVKNNSAYLIWTVPIVMLIVMRYSMIIESDSDGDPVEVVLHDKALLILIILYGLILILLLYLKGIGYGS